MPQAEHDEPPEPPAGLAAPPSLPHRTFGDHYSALPAAVEHFRTPHSHDDLHILNRSPHPYRRRRKPQPHSSHSSSSHSSNCDDSNGNGSCGTEGHLRPALASHSVSGSGTEADDEGYGFVKALPAPFIRPHKGLRTAGAESGLLTPSVLEEEGRRLHASTTCLSVKGANTDAAKQLLEDEEAKRGRDRFEKRRRAELLRRVCEVLLLGAVGTLVSRQAAAQGSLDVWSRGSVANGALPAVSCLLTSTSAELAAYITCYVMLIFLYPIRVLLLYPRATLKGKASRMWNRIHVSVVLDPAPLLYPSTMPILVSLSLCSGGTATFLLPNIVLAASALPLWLIPSYGHGPGFGMELWFISIIPLALSEHTDILSRIAAARPYVLKAPADRIGPETIVSLFALHHALLAPLRHLTTTSLLPAELHLLSIALINLLLFAVSPEMVILKSILWIGGLLLFISCGQVIRWNVALARIPRWRFKREGGVIKARQALLAILADGSRSRSSPSRSNRGVASDSDADDDDDAFPARFSDEPTLGQIDFTPGAIRHAASVGAKLALEALQGAMLPFEYSRPPSTRRGRRRTSMSLDTKKGIPRSTTAGSRHRKKSLAQSFLTLTPERAAVRKVLYAGWVYAAMMLIALGPVRAYIEKRALHGREPFGWLVGYLLGNIRRVRFLIFDWGLSEWACLPPLPDAATEDVALLPRAEHARQVLLAGAANTRLVITGYWLAVLVLGMATVLSLSATVEVDTRRKVFHGMMVAMLLPTIFIDPRFIALALGLVLVAFCLLDLVRAGQLPPLSKPLACFLAPYVDGRDLRGPVVVSHIFLLIGCAIPLWLTLAGRCADEPPADAGPWRGWDLSGPRDVSMVAGVVCVGMGDAAASLIGRRWGRRKWPWLGGKSLEGSVAFAAAVTTGLVLAKAWLRFGQWDGSGAGAATRPGLQDALRLVSAAEASKSAIAGAAASLMEAVLTGANDNVVVPVVLWLVVRGLDI